MEHYSAIEKETLPFTTWMDLEGVLSERSQTETNPM